MFEAWETRPAAWLVAEAAALDEVLAQLDAECRRRHALAVAELTTHPGQELEQYYFEIRGADDAVLATLSYGPDPTRPYESVIIDEMVQRGDS